jgi:cell division protein FtsB
VADSCAQGSKMQAPLRKGNKEETLGRAKGVTRTGRSLLFGLLLLGLAALSSLVYTWQRQVVESMLASNLELEKRLEDIKKETEILECEVVASEALDHIESLARERLDMASLCWDDVVVIEQVKGKAE